MDSQQHHHHQHKNRRRQVNHMALAHNPTWRKGCPSPNPTGRPRRIGPPPAPEPLAPPVLAARINHAYDAPTIGRMFVAVFEQPLSGATRTVEIVRYQGSDAWKARIKETGTVITRLGQQAEFAGDYAACNEITDYFGRQGMRMTRAWEATYPAWNGRPTIAESRRSIGGVQ
jgi:hypothetical protein